MSDVLKICWLALGLIGVATAAVTEPIDPAEIQISDGDTIRAHGERYRLVGYDTPETWSRRRAVPSHERALGKQARKRLKQLIAGGDVDLKEVPCACTKYTRKDEQGRCRTNGRLCGLLTVKGVNVGLTLIAEGLAREYICTENKCPEQLPW